MSTPPSRTLDALQLGFERGWQTGVQLAVYHRGELVIDYAQGLTTTDLMPWFSCTKLVTSVAVAQLVDRGRLRYDQRVIDVVPEFAPNGKGAVTLRHVLTHTGGFRRPAGTEEMFSGGIAPAELLQRIYDAPLEWDPGTKAGYHPVTGFHLLGEVIRRVDGRVPEDYLAEEIFEPLGMGDSWLCLTRDRAAAYGDRVVNVSGQKWFTWPLPSSSGIGPINELVRVAEALRRNGELDGERILSPDAVQTLTTRTRTGMKDETFGAVIDWAMGPMVNSIQYTGQPAPYGYGMHAGANAFGHGGQQSSIVFADPDYGVAVALAANGQPGEPNNHRRTQSVLTALYEDLSPSL